MGGRKNKAIKKRRNTSENDGEQNETSEERSETTKKKNKKASRKTSSAVSGPDRLFCALQAFYDASDRIRRALRIEKLDLTVRLSTGDAAATGFLVGIAYAEFYKLTAFLACLFTVRAPQATFEPVFSDDRLCEVTFDGIIQTNLAHSICAGAVLYLSYRKQIKQIKERVENNGTSNSGVNGSFHEKH